MTFMTTFAEPGSSGDNPPLTVVQLPPGTIANVPSARPADHPLPRPENLHLGAAPTTMRTAENSGWQRRALARRHTSCFPAHW